MLPAIRSIRVALRDVTPSFHPSEYQFSKVSGYNCPSTLCARIVIAVALQEVDDTPNAETGTECDYEGLKNGDCLSKKCHK